MKQPVFVTLKTLLRTLVLPPAGPMLLAAVGAFLVSRRAPARARGAPAWRCSRSDWARCGSWRRPWSPSACGARPSANRCWI